MLRTGELRVDLTAVAGHYGFGEALALIEAKEQGERTVLDESTRRTWQPRLDGLFDLLDRARDDSPLPLTT